MKRFTRLVSLLLALCLLTGCSFGSKKIDPAQEAEKAMEQVLDRLGTLTDQTRNMSDAELSQTIQGIAGEYHLTLNNEQMSFLISACRTLETAQSVGETAHDVGEQVSKVADTVHDISQGIGKVADTVSGLVK